MAATSLISAIVVTVVVIRPVASECPLKCSCNSDSGLYDCRDASLRGIPTQLPNPNSVKQLILSGNKIEVLASLDMYRNLVHLDLSNNQLEVIEVAVLSAAVGLKSLTLSKNRISVVESGMFRGLKNLEILALSNNDISEIGDGVFGDLSSLKNLDLSANVIKRIARNAFIGLESLNYLDLSRNPLTKIPSKSFAKLTMLKTLLIESNGIDIVQSNSFDGLAKLRKLSLRGNLIESVTESAFDGRKGPSALRYLSLKENKLLKVPTAALKVLKSLEELDLSGNLFEVVDPDSFKTFDRLLLLYMNNNPNLKVVRNYAFSELILLEELQLSGNRVLDSIEPHAFLATPSLKRLFLARNNLATIREEAVDWGRLEVLDLRYNPWRCICSLQWMGDMLKYVTKNETRYYTNDVYCIDVNNVHRPIIAAGPADFGCVAASTQHEFDHRIMFGIIGFMCLLLVVAFFVILYKFKIDIFKKCRSQMRYKQQTNLETVVTATMTQEQTPMKVNGSVTSSGEIPS